MNELTFQGLDIGLVEPGDDLVEMILTESNSEYPLQDGDVIIVTSKVVSTAENRLLSASDVTVTDRDERVAAVTGIDPREVAVIYEESDVLGAIPVADIGEELVMEHAVDPEAAEEALNTLPAVLITDRDGHLCTNAGVDWSNSPEDKMTLLPDDPDASAKRIRKSLESRTGNELAVVIADSEIMGAGTMDLAVGCSGIQAIDSNFGRTDLYGEPKIGGIDLIADELTAGSSLLFGQADERLPVVIVRGLDYERGEGVPNAGGLVRRGLRKTIQLTTRMKARELF